eukprot:Selendium_serpulae@DN11773_c0_g1_i1.p1
MDPTTSFLLTSHSGGHGGVSVWANRHLYDPAARSLLAAAEPTAPIAVDDPPPAARLDGDAPDDAAASTAEAEGGEEDEGEEAGQGRQEGARRRSGLSYDRLQAVVHHEAMKERNRPLRRRQPRRRLPFLCRPKLTRLLNWLLPRATTARTTPPPFF